MTASEIYAAAVRALSCLLLAVVAAVLLGFAFGLVPAVPR